MKKITQFVFLLSLLSLGSCKKNEVPADNSGTTTKTYTNKDINSWIYDQMKDWYYWTDNLPAKSSTTLDQIPGDDAENGYFYSILYQKDVTDRFSWLEPDVKALTNSLNGINKVAGIRYVLAYTNSTQTNIALFLNYVTTDSPAYKAGLRRGDIISQINNTNLTVDNYSTLMANETLTLTYGEVNANKEVTSTSKKVTVVKAEVQTNPIHYSSVITKGNKKIGYLVYTQFLSAYDKDLRTTFADFKAKGVNEFILDLRLNGGGYISSAVTLSSLLVKNLSADNVMYRDEWNQNIMKQYAASSFIKKFTNESSNLGTLSRVYVLTSSGSASASELVINSLKPYMEVILIGDHTYGKNVGSITLDDEENGYRWNWGLQPITLKTYNADNKSDYGTKDGFLPDVKVSDNVIPFKAWGDENETLLKKALEQITGVTVASSKNARESATMQVNLVSKLPMSDNPLLDRKDMFADPSFLKKK